MPKTSTPKPESLIVEETSTDKVFDLQDIRTTSSETYDEEFEESSFSGENFARLYLVKPAESIPPVEEEKKFRKDKKEESNLHEREVIEKALRKISSTPPPPPMAESGWAKWRFLKFYRIPKKITTWIGVIFIIAGILAGVFFGLTLSNFSFSQQQAPSETPISGSDVRLSLEGMADSIRLDDTQLRTNSVEIILDDQHHSIIVGSGADQRQWQITVTPIEPEASPE